MDARLRWAGVHNKNLATDVEGIYKPKYYTVTLKSKLRVTQGHRKQNRWIDHIYTT